MASNYGVKFNHPRPNVPQSCHLAHETCQPITQLSVFLKVVGELVSRLIQLDVIGAGHYHHDDPAVLELLDGTSELRSFRPELADRRLDVVAHQRDRVVTRVVVGFGLPIRYASGERPSRSAPI